MLEHNNLATTEVYLSIVNQSLHDAVRLLDERQEKPQETDHKIKGVAQQRPEENRGVPEGKEQVKKGRALEFLSRLTEQVRKDHPDFKPTIEIV